MQPTCIGLCRGDECASCGLSGLLWRSWLCLWPRAAHSLRRGPGDRPGTCLSPLRSILQDRLEQVGIKEKQTKQTCRQTLQSTSTLALSVCYATILWLRLRESSRGVGYMENARLFHIYLLHAVSLLGSPLGAFIANQ